MANHYTGRLIETNAAGMKELNFGFGGINFITTEDEPGTYGLLFREINPREIGAAVDQREIIGRSFEELGGQVHFVFHNVRALDALIEHLQEMRGLYTPEMEDLE